MNVITIVVVVATLIMSISGLMLVGLSLIPGDGGLSNISGDVDAGFVPEQEKTK